MVTMNLTGKQAYLAMFSFLEAEYLLTSSDEIGGLLGSMSLLPDGSTADPAVKDQWKEAVDHALRGEVNTALTLTK
jgi:hypothetical protein